MRRRSARRRFARLLILLVIVTVGAILLAPYLPVNQFKPEIESALSRQLGRKVTVGSVHLNLLRGPALVIEDLKASEDPAFGSGNTIEAGVVKVGLALSPLVARRQLVPNDVQFEDPHLTFTRNSLGAWSWSTLGKRAGQAALRRTGSGLGWGGDCIRSAIFPEVGRQAGAALISTLLNSGEARALKRIELRRASVTFVQGGRDETKQTTFNAIDLSAALSAQPGEPEPTTHAVGSIHASSEQTDSSELLAANLPFDVTAGVADVGDFTVAGTVGPGDITTSAFAAQNFKSAVTINANIARFDEIEASIYEGQLSGGLQLDLAAPRPRFAVEGKLNNVNIDQSIGRLFGIPGALTGHINGDFKLIGLMAQLPQCFPSISGDGQLSSEDLFVSNINLSEQVAKRLGVGQIGNMAPGTNVGHIDEQFRISAGSITIQNLHLKQLDGLGDATSDRATIDVRFSGARPDIQIDFPTTVTLSQEAAATAKQASPLLGIAAALLERSNQLSVPIHVTGDLLRPQVLVDLPRMLQSLGR